MTEMFSSFVSVLKEYFWFITIWVLYFAAFAIISIGHDNIELAPSNCYDVKTRKQC